MQKDSHFLYAIMRLSLGIDTQKEETIYDHFSPLARLVSAKRPDCFHRVSVVDLCSPPTRELLLPAAAMVQAIPEAAVGTVLPTHEVVTRPGPVETCPVPNS